MIWRLENLRNKYYALRHGESEANKKQIIISRIDDDGENYCLTPEGQAQVERSVKAGIVCGYFPGEIVITASPFIRCRETANLAQKFLGAKEIIVMDELRERNFGSHEGARNEDGRIYEAVWQNDRKAINENNVERLVDVLRRMIGALLELEKKYENASIILVSHGDPLQILQCRFDRVGIHHHRNLIHLKPGELRKLGK